MNVLVLEDDLPFRNRLLDALGRAGPDVQVEAVGTIAEALGLRERRPDVMLVDVMLADEDVHRSGVDFVRDARARGCAAPVVLMSRVVPDVLQTLSLQAGALGWWRKGLLASGDLYRLLTAVASDAEPVGEAFVGLSDQGRLCARQLRVRARACLSDDVEERAAVVRMTAHLVRDALAGHGTSVSALARELDLARSTLEAYVPFARWPIEDLEEVFRWVGAHGKHLTISHLLAASSLPMLEAKMLLREAAAGECPVKVLRERIASRARR